MITPDKMMKLLLEASPSFRTNWELFLDYWEEEKDNLPYYLILSEYADHMVNLLRDKDIESLQRIFHVVEKLHIEGDGYVKEAATVGLLEDFQKYISNEGIDSSKVTFLFGPETDKWWNKLIDYWQKGVSLEDTKKRGRF